MLSTISCILTVKAFSVSDLEDSDSIAASNSRPQHSTNPLYSIYKHICHKLDLERQEAKYCTESLLDTDIHTGIDDIATNLKSTAEM